MTLTRNPQFSVRFITEHIGEFTVTDTHDAITAIEVERQLGQATGAWQLTMVPRRIAEVPSRQWWDAIGPMDYVEIRLWVPPRRSEFPVLRGFVDTVGFTAHYGARGQRAVSILGRDYGKLMLNTKLYYPTGGVQQVALFTQWRDAFTTIFGDVQGQPPERPPMGDQQTTEGPNFSPSDLQRAIFEGFYQPQESEVLKTFEGISRPPGVRLNLEAQTDPWEAKLRTYSPAFFQKGMQPWSALWDLIFAYQHRPWRELLMTESTDAPVFTFRPSPWLTKEGEWVQGTPGSSVVTWDIADAQIVSLTLSRTDAQVLNFLMSFPEAYAFLAQMAKETGALEGIFKNPLRENPYLVGFDEGAIPGIPTPTKNPAGADTLVSRFQRYGFRIAEIGTPYLSMERGLRESQVQLQIADLREQGAEGTKRLRAAFDHNHLLEDGSLTVRGDERLQVGSYIRLVDRGGPRYYVESVHHELKVGTQPGDGHFLTHLGLSRGRGHLVHHYGFEG